MSNGQTFETSEEQSAEIVSQTMKLIIALNGSQLKEIRRFVDTLLQIRHRQGKKDEE
ncbi:MAG: hypothetical protein PHY18_05390 [Dehalococcoidales bacterium]|nr:hypothetical protein [Dehalococcoidales bacterium]